MTIPSVGGADQPYCSFYVGQKVICIDASAGGLPEASGRYVLVENGVYVVSDICVYLDTPGVQLAEFNMSDGVWAYWLRADRFRPATDISVFEAVLERAPIENTRRLRELEREGA